MKGQELGIFIGLKKFKNKITIKIVYYIYLYYIFMYNTFDKKIIPYYGKSSPMSNNDKGKRIIIILSLYYACKKFMK
jgi:hypothetical protein